MRRPILVLCVLVSAAACSYRIGSHCADDGDCRFVDGGYCAKVQVCTVSCAAEDGGPGQCPARSTCVAASGRWVCLADCSRDEDCRSEDRCTGVSGAQVCFVRDVLR